MDRQGRKTEYLKSFTEAFSEHGIDRTSIKKLAAAADINEASIYQYFKNKDEIILDCVKLYFQFIVEKICPILLEDSFSVEDRVKMIYGLCVETAGAAKFMIQVLASPAYEKLCAPVIRQFTDHLKKDAEHVSKQFAISTDQMTALLFLFNSVAISDKIINQREVTFMQLKLLIRLLKKDPISFTAAV